jgi:hypothetical protein
MDIKDENQGAVVWGVYLFFSGSAILTGGLRLGCCGTGARDAIGGKTDGVIDPIFLTPFAVVGLGGECFVGEMPVTVVGRVDV